MGNYRFRLSNMMPNAWFYKLKEMARSKNQKTTQPKKKKHHRLKSSSSSSSSSSSASAAAAAPPQLSGPTQPHLCHQRKSYHFTRDLNHPPNPDTIYDINSGTSPKAPAGHFSEPPRISSKKRRSTKRTCRSSNRAPPRLVTSTGSADCSCRTSLQSVWSKPDSTPEEYPNYPLDTSSEDDSLFPELDSDNGLTVEQSSFDNMVSWSNSCHCRFEHNIVVDMNHKSFHTKFENLDGFDSVSKFELPPIITKTDKREINEGTKFRKSSANIEERNLYGSLSVKVVKEDTNSNSFKEQRTSTPAKKLSFNSPGVKLRTNSPRIASRKIQFHGRKSVSAGSRRSLSESFAVVKSSQDPLRDFKESMVEMITENNIRASKDLEDLLACYLSLNSNEYHDLIIKVFKQIWFDITDIRLK